MIEKSNYKRWYDRQPKLAKAVQLISLMPNEIKTIVCEALMVIANRELDQSEQDNSFRTLGSEKIMGVHKAKNKRRDYDRNEMLHKTMTYLYILSDDGQDQIADHILNMVHYIQQYFQACQEFKVEPQLEQIGEITRHYIERGGKEVQIFLRNLREAFSLKFKSEEHSLSPEELLSRLASKASDQKTRMKDDQSGMKVSKLKLR